MNHTCSNCKHWNQSTHKQVGTCAMVEVNSLMIEVNSLGDVRPSPTAFSICLHVPVEYSCVAELVTGAQFFCLLWEPKGDEE